METKSFYKGVRYQEVVEKNQQKGGDILEVTVQRKGAKETAVIVTDYADGLTVSTDTLVYEGEYLQSWTLAFGCKEPIPIFLRDEYEGIKREMAML